MLQLTDILQILTLNLKSLSQKLSILITNQMFLVLQKKAQLKAVLLNSDRISDHHDIHLNHGRQRHWKNYHKYDQYSDY